MTPEELFYGFPEPVPDLCWRLRDIVLDVVSGAEERVRPGWMRLSISVSPSRQDVCAIAPQRDHARLMFERGGDLKDPDGRLHSSGGQGRYLRFEREADVEEAVVRAFLEQVLQP